VKSTKERKRSSLSHSAECVQRCCAPRASRKRSAMERGGTTEPREPRIRCRRRGRVRRAARRYLASLKFTSKLILASTGCPFRVAGRKRYWRSVAMACSSRPRPSPWVTTISSTVPSFRTVAYRVTVPSRRACRASLVYVGCPCAIRIGSVMTAAAPTGSPSKAPFAPNPGAGPAPRDPFAASVTIS